MDIGIHKYPALSALFGILLLVLTPVLCELDHCCAEESEAACAVGCEAICCAVAVCAELSTDAPALDARFTGPFVFTSALPQGVLPLPERPPIVAC